MGGLRVVGFLVAHGVALDVIDCHEGIVAVVVILAFFKFKAVVVRWFKVGIADVGVVGSELLEEFNI